MNRWWLFVPLGIFALFVGLAAYQLTQPKDDFVHSEMIGKKLPQFDLRAATGGKPGKLAQRRAARYRGPRVTVP